MKSQRLWGNRGGMMENELAIYQSVIDDVKKYYFLPAWKVHTMLQAKSAMVLTSLECGQTAL